MAILIAIFDVDGTLMDPHILGDPQRSLMFPETTKMVLMRFIYEMFLLLSSHNFNEAGHSQCI